LQGFTLYNSGVQRFVDGLDDETVRYSILEGLPADVVYDRLASGWKPTDDSRTLVEWLRSMKQNAGAEGKNIETVIQFSNPLSANKCLAECRRQGLATKAESAYRISITTDRSSMQHVGELAQRFGGTISALETPL
jgi:hypothetical protein